MNWAVLALAVTVLVHAVIVAFYFGKLTSRLEQLEEWRDGRGNVKGVRWYIHELWDWYSGQKAKQDLEKLKQ